MKHEENLREIFDIEATEEDMLPAVQEPMIISTDEEAKREEDFDLARRTLRNLIEKTDDALDEVLELAKNDEKARSYEVAQQMVKTLADVSKDLIEIHNKKKELYRDSEVEQSGQTTNNNVFVGSTDELMQLLQGKREAKTLNHGE